MSSGCYLATPPVFLLRESTEIAWISRRRKPASHLLRRLDLPRQLAQLGNGRAHLGVVARGATTSTVGLDRSEPFLEH